MELTHLMFLAFAFQVLACTCGMAYALVMDEWLPGKPGDGDPASYQSGKTVWEVGSADWEGLDHGEEARHRDEKQW